MVEENEIEAALDYLRDSAEKAAQATADRKHLEEFRKAKLAMLASDMEGSEAARDRLAHAHPEYLALLDGLKEAVRRDEYHRHQRKRAELLIDAWRSQSATQRAMKI